MTGSINASAPGPEPDPDEAARGIQQMEQWLADWSEVPQDLPDGETERVRRLRAEVAEAHQLQRLYADTTPIELDSPRVRKRRRRVAEAHKLHELGQDPRALAWTAARVRRIVVGASMTALALALAWSTAGVQRFAAGDAPAGSAIWLFAWTIEPFLSLALLSIVGVRAFLGAHGRPVRSRKLTALEGLFLGLTVTMNGYPHLPGVAEPFRFEALMIHLIGPIVAVAIVTGLPVLLDALSRLDIDAADAPPTAPTGATYSGNTPTYRSVNRADAETLTARALELIDAGELPAEPSATAIRNRFRCGTDVARAVRDAIKTLREAQGR